MSKLFIVLITILVIVLFTKACYAQQQTTAADKAAIEQVLDKFMQSIIKKDTATFVSLFASHIPIAWVDVQSRETLAIAQKTNAKAAAIEHDDYKNFVRYIGTSKDALEEKFYNVKIRTDGLLASVSFDYSFWSNNKKENRGQENWELVFDGNNWKIAGVYYSYILESVTKQP
jgi:hypothetical protein